jgi:hypothetical protein
MRRKACLENIGDGAENRCSKSTLRRGGANASAGRSDCVWQLLSGVLLKAFVIHVKMHVPSHMDVVNAHVGHLRDYLTSAARSIGPSSSREQDEPVSVKETETDLETSTSDCPAVEASS